MGESTVIVHGILIIVSVMLAAMLALVVFNKLGYIESIFSQAIREKADAVGLRLLMVNAYKNSTTGEIYVYVKNVGSSRFSDYQSIDLYLGNYTGPLDYYQFTDNTTPSTGYFTISELGEQDNIWEPGETLIFLVNPSNTYGDILRVKIVLPNGVSAEDVVEVPAG